jgi:FKBP-type peptidyl-prolyl cis-trans isomerase FklB
MVRVSIVMLAVVLFAGVAVAQEQNPLKTDKDRLSYALGMDLGNQMMKQSIDLDPELFARGLKDAFARRETLMTEDDARVIISLLQKELMAKQAAASKEVGEKNKAEGAAFLARNLKEPGVVTLPSGLQYKPLKTGDGPKPIADDAVVCHYRGTLIDGKEFDSSYRRNEPATLPLKNVIKGWSEALQLMTVGSKWQIFIPPELAYGERGAGADIGPNATLIFEVELIAIKGKS